ncbi:MAG: hypothetical protein JJT94_09040 [Bernardetiaceae bacterium]|nr:hypothetical protein [Bernardetiaceae bacterium]
MKQNCMIFIFLFLFSSPLIAQKDFEGVLTYEAGDIMKDGAGDWVFGALEAYKVYIKGDKIIVKFAYADAGVPEEEEFMFYEYMDLKRKKYYKVAEPRVSDGADKNPKLKILQEQKLKKIQPKIKEVSLIQADTTTSKGEAASLYRVVLDCEGCLSHVWVAKEKDIKIKRYPLIAYTYSAIIDTNPVSESESISIQNESLTGGILSQEGFYFTDFSSHFEGVILELQVSLEGFYEAMRRRNPDYPIDEVYNGVRLISIEEKELPDSFFELELE